MSKVERVANHISECLGRCRMSGFTLATLVQFLDELRATGHSEADVQLVDKCMRQLLQNLVEL